MKAKAPVPTARNVVKHREYWREVVVRQVESVFKTIHVLGESQGIADLPQYIREHTLVLLPTIVDRAVRAHSEQPKGERIVLKALDAKLHRKLDAQLLELIGGVNANTWDEFKQFRQPPPDDTGLTSQGK